MNPKELERVYSVLTQDKTTKRRIVWGTDDYEEYGKGYLRGDAVKVVFGKDGDFGIERRLREGEFFKRRRVKRHAEVFTPAWICNKMINYCDKEWFGRKDVFNVEGDKSWRAVPGKIEFSGKRNWKTYVDSRRLEITCGEAPYIVSRYDAATGKEIEIGERIGILDRKLRVVGENAESEGEWLKWAVRAFQSVYGYEMQGDNLILCRRNLLLTFRDYLKYRWNREPALKELKKIANIIAWNFWQMDGLKGTSPSGCECKIRDWRSGKTLLFKNIGVHK